MQPAPCAERTPACESSSASTSIRRGAQQLRRLQIRLRMRLAVLHILPRHHRAKAIRQPMRREMLVHPRPPRRRRQAKRQRQRVQRLHQLNRAQPSAARRDRRRAPASRVINAPAENPRRNIPCSCRSLASRCMPTSARETAHRSSSRRISAHAAKCASLHQSFGIDQRAVEIEHDGQRLTRQLQSGLQIVRARRQRLVRRI